MCDDRENIIDEMKCEPMKMHAHESEDERNPHKPFREYLHRVQ